MEENEKLKELQKLFSNYGLRKKTIFYYTFTLSKIGLDKIDNLEYVKEYLKTLPVSTRYLTISALRTYYKLTNQMEKYLSLQQIKYRSNEKKRILSAEEIKKLLEACKSKEENLILRLFLATGIRRSVLINIKLGDITANGIYVRKSYEGNKAKRDYIAPIYDEKLREDLINYCKERKIKANEPIFKKFFEERKYKTPKEIQLTNLVKEIGKRAGIYVTPHILRHTFGTAFYIATKDVVRTKSVLGQTSISATERYVHIAEMFDEETKKKVERMLFGKVL